MKSYLYNPDKTVILNHKTVTVGSSDCDLILDDPRVESCHAILEFNEDKQCYVIRDLNTDNGTYVNDCKIQNNTVYLAYGDIIRFGNGGKAFELRKADSYDTLNQSQAIPTSKSYFLPKDDSCLPQISFSKPKLGKNITMTTSVYPHPPTRPHSASDRLQSIKRPSPTDSYKHPRTVWSGSFDPVLQQKQLRLLNMVDEIKSFNEQEKESQKKDAVINGMKEEIMRLYEQLNENQVSCGNQMMTKLWGLERELEEKSNETKLLQLKLDAQLSSSPTLTSQLANKEKSIHELRHDLDKTSQEFSMSQGLMQSLQRELITNQNDLKKKEVELTKFKKNLKDRDIQFQSLANKFTKLHDGKAQEDALASVNTEVKTLKTKLRRLEMRSSDHSSLLQRYKTETAQLNEIIKRQELEKAQWEKQKMEQKQKLLEIQRTERLLRVDLEQSKGKSSRFRESLSRVLYTATSLKAPDYPLHVQESKLIGDLEDYIAISRQGKEKLKDSDSELEKLKTQFSEINSSVELMENTLLDVNQTLNENGHHKQILKDKKELFLSLTVPEITQSLKKAIADLLESEIVWNADITQAIQSAGYDTEVAEKRPSYFIHNLHEKSKNNETRVTELEKTIDENKSNHAENLQQVRQLLQDNASETMANEIQRIREEEKEKRICEIGETKDMLEGQFNKEREQQTINLNNIQEQLESTSEQFNEKVKECEEYLEKLSLTESDLESTKAEVIQLREDLKTTLLKSENEVGSLADDRRLLKSQFDEEVKQYKEEVRQHSITIVAMEERLQSVLQQLKNAQEEVERMQRQTIDTQKQKSYPSHSPMQSTILRPNIDTYEQTIAMLRGELLASQQQFHLQQDEMTSLRRELTSTLARMSDLKGELSEPQKEELEHGRRKLMEQEMEIEKLRQKMLKMTELTTKQHEELKKLKSERVVHSAVSVPAVMDVPNASSVKLSSEEDQVETRDTGTQEDRSGKINAELTSQGAVCRGERHEAIITRQREALAELRARIKALENAQPVTPNHEDLTQQVILLKKELAEIRAKQTMEDDVYFRDQLTFAQNQQTQRTPRSSTGGKSMEADVERNARIQLEEAVASSEQSYMDLANTIGGLLRVNILAGMRPISHIPTDERLKVTDDRRADLETFGSQIKSLVTRLDRKDNLLQTYEKDLAKLREAEDTAEKKTAKVNVLLDEITQKSEENTHLREALNRAEEKFHQEKRLNSAIKQKKTFYLENLDHRDRLPHHDPCNDEGRNKSEKTKKKFKTSLMKKEYEIQVLKQKLQQQERDLCRTAARVAITQETPRRNIIKKSTSSSSSSSSSSRRDLEY